MNKKLKQLSAQFPDLLSTYKTNWSPEPFDFLLQEEKTVIDIDTVDSLFKNKEQILKKVKAANAHGYTVIRILDTPNVFNKLVLKRTNQFICPNNEYNELIQCLEEKEEKEAIEVKEDKNTQSSALKQPISEPDYSTKTMGELKDIAKSLGIPKAYMYNKETKGDLIKLIFEKQKQK
jgi:hypothetical protein